MDELQKALEIADQISVKGAQKEKAIAEFLEQIRSWGVALPKAEFLVWDFGIKDFYKVGLIECWICNEVPSGYCGKYLFLQDGQTCPRHYHKTKDETFFIVKGEAMIELDNKTVVMKPGDALFVPSGKPHSFTGRGPALLLEISKPCIVDDNYFFDTRIPIGGNYQGGSV